MRIILLILSVSAVAFVWWIISQNTAKMGFGNAWWNQSSIVTEIPTTSSVISNADPQLVQAIEQDLRARQNEERISRLEEKIGQISSGVTPTKITETKENTENLPQTPPEIIPVSAKFPGKILPTIELTKIDNNGIFDLRIFDNINYTTYSDKKFEMTVVAAILPYETFLKNFQAIDKNVYTVNEKTPFPFESFYVNPAKADSLVRIVMKVEAQTLFITLPKEKFNIFKELILKKNS